MTRIKYYNFIPVLLLLFTFYACRTKNEFVIKGQFQKTDPTPVELFLLQENNTQRIDSVFASGNSFTLRGTIDHSSIYLLRFFNNQSIYLVIHPNDQIGLDIDNTMREITYYVDNSPDSKYVRELTDQQNKVLKQIDQLSIEWEKNLTDTLIRKRIDSTYFTLLKKHQDYTRKFIYEHPKSLANILAIYQNFGRKGASLFDKYEDLDIYNFVDSMLTPVYPETEAVLALNRGLSETRDQIRQKTLIEKKVEIGYPLPVASVTTIEGDSITIGGPGSNSILLIFWASWNTYSVEELKSIQDFYKNSRLNSKLDIISISLDSSEEKLHESIALHEITIPVVCDFNYWDSDLVARYVIKRIPSVILADKKGKVIVRDISSAELINRINETIE